MAKGCSLRLVVQVYVLVVVVVLVVRADSAAHLAEHGEDSPASCRQRQDDDKDEDDDKDKDKDRGADRDEGDDKGNEDQEGPRTTMATDTASRMVRACGTAPAP